MPNVRRLSAHSSALLVARYNFRLRLRRTARVYGPSRQRHTETEMKAAITPAHFKRGGKLRHFPTLADQTRKS